MSIPTSPEAAPFAAGNYAAAALQGGPDDWQTHAALGLIGKSKEAIRGLNRFDHPEARFYSAVASWMEGDEQRAIGLLKEAPGTHAQNLLTLLRKKKINVLTQLDRGSQWDFITALQHDHKFAVQNVGFRPGDLPNKPEADVHQFYDRRNPPDFYVAKLVEWHVLPPNLQELPCPILGHTADYDIHIQTVYPWLQLFDDLVVTDPTEWQDVSRLVQSPVSTFPKAFGLSGGLPPVPDARRPTDVFVSGTALHPYHPDKARLLHQILAMPEVAVKFINGFLGPAEYHQLLGQTKVGFTYVRHSGAMPTRGLESLAMGAAIAVQEGSVLQLFVGEAEGVVTYHLEKENLPGVVRRILSQWPEFARRARRGAAVVRQEFEVARVASQYFRFLTFLAAKPRGPRRLQPRERLDQKRSILLKGWVQPPRVNRLIRQQSFARWSGQAVAAARPQVIIDMARELMLEYATAAYQPVARDYAKNFQIKMPVDRTLLAQALRLYRAGVERFPDSLVLRFNGIRAALHFGEPSEVSEALGLAEATLARPLSEWRIDVMDDVFPWDYFSQFFNYRAYFDWCTGYLQTREPVEEKLARLIAASLHYYLSFYPEVVGTSQGHPLPQVGPGWPAGGVGEWPASPGAAKHATSAVDLDPTFPFYKLQCARQLARLDGEEATARATSLLADLTRDSMLFLQGFDLWQSLPREKQAAHAQFDSLAAKVEQAAARIWTANYGVEDWDAIPLLMPAWEGSGGRAPRPALEESVLAGSAPGQREGAARILFLPLEIGEWKQARHLAYPAQLGLEEGLAASGVEFLTLPSVRGLSLAARTAWVRQLRERCAGRRFDQVWLEIVHSEWDEESLRWIAELAPKRVGFLMESLRYDDQAVAIAPYLQQRQALVEERLPFLTHLVAVDEKDVADLNERGLVHAIWWPQAVPERFIAAVPPPPPDARALFYGQLYGARESWLEHPALAPLLWRPDVSPEDRRGYPRLFDELNRSLGSLLERGVALSDESLEAHAAALRRLRRASFEAWLASLQNGGAVVNLPSLFQGYAGRVFEAMAAGRPVVSWEIPDRPRTRLLFAEGEEIFLFPKEDPAALVEHLRRLQREPDLARKVAGQARTKLLRLHTVETRVRQIVDWIESGLEPDFALAGEARPLARTPREAYEIEGSPMNRTLGRAAGKGAPTLAAAPRAAAAAELLAACGNARLQLGEFQPAWEHLNQAASFEPNNLSVQAPLAAAAMGSGRAQEFEAAVQRVLAREADHLGVWTILGELGLGTVELAQAAEMHQLLLLREPGDLPASVNLVLAQASPGNEALAAASPDRQRVRELIAGHLPQAMATAQRRARQRNATEIPAAARLGHLQPARELFRQHDLAAAWPAVLEAIRARPFHPEAFLLLAEIAHAAGDPAKARQCAERARKLAPRWKLAQPGLTAVAAKGKPLRVSLPPLPSWAPRSAPRLTVCLIAKNEERFLGRCLESVRSVADQIVVVDTGSTDWTREIAARFGAEVYSFDWSDDFSAARNAALERATGDWILMLDADEELLAEKVEVLRREMRVDNVLAYRLPLVDVGREEQGQSYVPRLFRNAPGLFFVGRVHEQIFSSLEVRRAEWRMENRFGTATLLHHGYTEELVRERNKNARNLALLEKAIEELPNEPNLVMNYGLELMRAGQPSAGLEQYWEAFRLMSALPREQVVSELRETLLTQLATHLLGAKNCAGVQQVLDSPLAKSGGLTASHHFLLGLAFLESGRFQESASQMRLCLSKRDQMALSPVHKDIRKGGPRHCLALCQKYLKQPMEAARNFREALAEDPASRPVRYDYAPFLAEQGHPVEALQLLHELASEKPEDAGAWLLGGKIALSRPEFLEFARDWTAEALKHFPRHPQFAAQRAEALLLDGQVGEALLLWRRSGGAEDPRRLAARVICELLSGGSCPVPAALELTVSREFLKWYQAFATWQTTSVLQALNVKTAQLQQMLPSAGGLLEQAMLEAGKEISA